MAETRFYIRLAKSSIGDRKMAALSDAEKWAWAAFLIMADDVKPAGTLTESIEDLAYRGRVDEDVMRSMIDKFISMDRPPITRNEDGSLSVTNWKDHQTGRFASSEPDSQAQRQRESRMKRDVTTVTSVTNVTNGEMVSCDTASIHPMSVHNSTGQKRKVVEKGESEGEKESSQNSEPSAAGAAPPSDSNENGKAKAKRQPKQGRAMPEECPRYTDLYHAEVVNHRAGTSKADALVEWQRWHAYHRAKGGTIKDFRASWRTWVLSKFWDGGSTVHAGSSFCANDDPTAGGAIWAGGERDG